MRVVIADDSVFVREGLARILERRGFEVVAQADNAEQLLLKVRSYDPDVVITDIRMPPNHTDEGLRAAREIRTRHAGTAVLVLSQHLEPAYAMDCWPSPPRASATCSRTVSRTPTSSPTPCGASLPRASAKCCR